MSEVKLFGTTIHLPCSNGVVSDQSHHEDDRSVSSPNNGSSCLDDKYYAMVDDDPPSTDPSRSSMGGDSPKTPSQEEEHSSFKSPQKKEQSDPTTSQEKPLKKPDKLLPCPRCKSMDTKFCYFNNYNVNQPRHFCKKCQRYWTAGGTMRNVPVGAGRRKNKNSLRSQHPPTDSVYGRFPAHPWAPVQWGPAMPAQPYVPYWGCGPSWPMTWLQGPTSLVGNREQNGEENSKKGAKLIAPKTLKTDFVNSGGLFGGFRPKGGEISSVSEPCFALHANPAALSRSLTFHESGQ